MRVRKEGKNEENDKFDEAPLNCGGQAESQGPAHICGIHQGANGVAACFLCLRFRPRAVGGCLPLTRDDLVRCERALSNLRGNKLEVIFYESCIPEKPWPPARHAVSPADMFIKRSAAWENGTHVNTHTDMLTHRHINTVHISRLDVLK